MKLAPISDDGQCPACGFRGTLEIGDNCPECGGAFDEDKFDATVAAGDWRIGLRGVGFCNNCKQKMHFNSGLICSKCGTPAAEGSIETIEPEEIQEEVADSSSIGTFDEHTQHANLIDSPIPEPDLEVHELNRSHRKLSDQPERPTSQYYRNERMSHYGLAIGKLVGCCLVALLLALILPHFQGFFIPLGILTGFGMAHSELLRAKESGHAAKSASLQERMESGELPKLFILFLRGFRSDMKTQENMSRITPGLEIESTEQKILSRLPQYEVIAIGDPEEDIPKLGAARLYFTDEDWQTAALNLMEKASLIVMRPGSGRFLTWELEQIAEHFGGEKFILCGYRAGMTSYANFVRKHEAILKIDPEPKKIPFFVTFNNDWTLCEEVYFSGVF